MAYSPYGLPLTYTLTGSPDFAIDSSTGALTATTTLDYGAMPEYALTVQATDRTNTTSVNVNISLADTSSIGNALVCTEETVQNTVLEETLNIRTSLPTCFNGDGSVALISDLTYTISRGDPTSLFDVDPGGFLVTNNSPLDYETQTMHILTLDVENSELPPRRNTLIVVITVAPANEYPPVFSSDPIQISVLEAVRIGDTIGRVEATDQDSGGDGTITYTLMSPSSSLIFIHPDSGSIILTGSLDYESAQVHNFTVVASDSSLEPVYRFTTSASLSVIVLDANDNPPTFTRPIYFVEVRENSNLGHLVATLTCSDRDTGVNSDVTYSIVEGNTDNKFALDARTGLITLLDTLDYDAVSAMLLYSLRVRCRESRPPNAMDECVVLIRITSFNEFDPDPGNPYMTTVRENTPAGTEILQVRGRDRDYGLAGTLRYFLNLNNLATCPDNLYMDESSGRVYHSTTKRVAQDMHAL